MTDKVKKLRLNEMSKAQKNYLKYCIYYDAQKHELTQEQFDFISNCNYDSDIPDSMVEEIFANREIREDFFPEEIR